MTKRASRQDWVNLGLQLLDEGAHPASVTQIQAAERLGVTKGSFTHYFPNADLWYEAVLAQWSETSKRERERDALHASVMRDPVERLKALRLSATASPASDTGMRAWTATGGPGAKEAGKALEEVRSPVRDQVAIALRDLGFPADEREVMTEVLLSEFGCGPGDPSVPLDNAAGFTVLLRVIARSMRELKVTTAEIGEGDGAMMVFVPLPKGAPALDPDAVAEVAQFARSRMTSPAQGPAADGCARPATRHVG